MTVHKKAFILTDVKPVFYFIFTTSRHCFDFFEKAFFTFWLSFNAVRIKCFTCIFKHECHRERYVRWQSIKSKTTDGEGRGGGWMDKRRSFTQETGVCIPCEIKSKY